MVIGIRHFFFENKLLESSVYQSLGCHRLLKIMGLYGELRVQDKGCAERFGDQLPNLHGFQRIREI